MRIIVVSDIHYACAAEKQRRGHETRVIRNRWLRGTVKAFRRWIWMRDPFANNPLVEAFLAVAGPADLVVANGDFSCDTAFVGVSDSAAYESTRLCLALLRQRFDNSFVATIGDHELGKMSIFGGQGGPRLASWDRAHQELGLQSFWQRELGGYVMIGVTSTLLAFPVYEPESLPGERAQWQALRQAHLRDIRSAFASLPSGRRVLLFLHDPTALPFLWQEVEVRRRLAQVEQTFIGHLHTNLVWWKSRLLAGIPRIRFLGNSIRRMSEALSEARYWRPFHVRLCPALAGIELLKGGGFLELDLGPEGAGPLRVRFRRIPRAGGELGASPCHADRVAGGDGRCCPPGCVASSGFERRQGTGPADGLPQ